jgi:hypothetical protein
MTEKLERIWSKRTLNGGVKKKMKKVIRKIAAVGAGVAMLAATLGGSMALNTTLGDWPEPFVENEAFVNAAIVATSGDASARDDVNTYMSGMVTTTSTSDVTVSGGKTDDDIQFEDGFNDSFGLLDDTDISALQDGKITHDNSNYDIRELINFTGDTKITTSGGTGEFDFGADPYIESAQKGLKYWFWFDDVLNITAHPVNTSQSFSLTFMGKELDVIDVTCTAGSEAVTVQMATEVGVYEGDTVACEGGTVEVTGIYSTSVGIKYGTKEKFINTGSSYDFGACTVKVESVGFNSNDPALSRAIISTGEKISDTVSDGEAFELFTNYEPDGDAPWAWRVKCSATADQLVAIGAYLKDDVDDIDDDDTNPDPWKVGEVYAFPGDFAAISFDSLNVGDSDRASVDITTSTNCDMNATTGYKDKDCIIFRADGDFLEINNENVQVVYALERSGANINDTWDLWYEDTDGTETDDTTAAATFKIKHDDTELVVYHINQTGNASFGYVKIKDDTNVLHTEEDIWISMNDGFEDIGNSSEYESSSAIVELNTTVEGDISGRDYDVLTPYGIVIEDPENNLDADKVVLSVPPEAVKASVTVSAEVTSSGTGTGASAELVAPGDVTDKTAWNLLLLGGPCVNSLTAEFLGLTYPACGDAATGFSEGQGMIKMFDNGDKVAVVVAGWAADDTRRAAKVLANPSSFTDDLAGKTSVTVTGEGLEVSGISVA